MKCILRFGGLTVNQTSTERNQAHKNKVFSSWCGSIHHRNKIHKNLHRASWISAAAIQTDGIMKKRVNWFKFYSCEHIRSQTYARTRMTRQESKNHVLNALIFSPSQSYFFLLFYFTITMVTTVLYTRQTTNFRFSCSRYNSCRLVVLWSWCWFRLWSDFLEQIFVILTFWLRWSGR